MFISPTREKILRLFFNNPGLLIHQRGIARQADVVPQNVNKYLNEFVRDGLLLRSEIPHLTLFRINSKSDFVFKIFEVFELNRKKEFYTQNEKIARLLNQYTENLVRLSQREIQMVVLFGPVTRGKWTKGSHVDILTVTSTTVENKKITRIQEKAALRIGHLLKISPVHVTMGEFVEGIKNKLELYDELRKDRIVLYNEFLFWQSIREAKF
jgi:predicted nucleotidyltransferase